MIGQEYQSPTFGIAIADATQPCRVVPARVEYNEFYFLVAEQSCAVVDRPRVHALEFEVGFGAGDKETGRRMVEALEVEVAAIHHVEGARLGNEHIEDVDIVQFAV